MSRFGLYRTSMSGDHELAETSTASGVFSGDETCPAVGVPKPSTSPSEMTGQIVDHGWLLARRMAWDALLARAEYQTVAFSSVSMDAHVSHAHGEGVRYAVVQAGDELLALLPFRPGRIGIGRRTAQVWASPYAINATPLVGAERRQEVISKLLDTLAAQGPEIWHFPLLAINQPLVRDIRAAARARGWPSELFALYGRPRFWRCDHQSYLKEHLSRGERKSLRRRLNGLTKLGRVEFQHATEGSDLAAAVASFLALELQGWKGRRGTAMASRPYAAAFLRQLFDGQRGPVSVRADWLALDSKPLAVSLSLICGSTACLLKTTYDEQYARFGPGVLLEHELVRACCHGELGEVLDSNSLSGELLDRVFPGREAIGELLLATKPTLTSARIRQLVRQEQLWRSGMKAAKRAYWRMVDQLSALRPASP